MRNAITIVTILVTNLIFVGLAHAETSLTITEVRRLALEYNRQVLQSQEDVAIAQAEVSQAWGGALPNIQLHSSYSHNFKVPSVFFVADGETVELQTGFAHSFNTTVQAVQPIWHGGKVFTALQIAKLYRDYSEAIAAQVEAAVVLRGEQLFYTAIQARSQLAVQQSALEANDENLSVVQKMHDQGMVSDFELLRAQVEQQNVLPAIIAAEAEVDLADKRLKSFLGLPLAESIILVEDQTDTSLVRMPKLDELIETALNDRPEVIQARELTRMSRKNVGIARADKWPAFDAVGAFNWSAASDEFDAQKNNSRSWTAGLNLSYSIFNGGQTKGQIAEAKAQYRQAQLQEEQLQDDISLEVEAAYTRLRQAKKSLDVQRTTIAAAEEGLRIAQVRYESGVGTQLEVLSAQEALTQARNALAFSLYSFRVAKAELKKATTIDI